MSSPLFSDDEAETGRSASELLKQNQMKDLALSKATNLIELLNIQLEVQRNSSQEALRALQQELKQRYEKQLKELQQKVELLERELRKNIANDKTIRSRVLTRANSAKSLQNKLKRSSVNKKYTETNPNEQTQKQSSPHIISELFRQQMVELEDWRAGMMTDIDNLVKSQYDDLEKIIIDIEGASEEFRTIASFKPKPRRDLYDELTEIVRAQNKIIHSLNAYTQELQDLCKSTNYKLNSLLSRQQISFNNCEIDFHKVSQHVCALVAMKKEQFRSNYSSLESQNSELKNILDNMIRLVKEEKRIR